MLNYKMISKYYTSFLVFMQFILIGLLLFLNNSIFSSIYSLIISIIGAVFGLYTLYFNRISNFNIRPDIKKDAHLITKGAYKYVRHPMYLSVVVIMLGVITVNPNILSFIVYFILIYVLYLKAIKEESLWSKNDKDYKNYKSNTKMFIPFIV